MSYPETYYSDRLPASLAPAERLNNTRKTEVCIVGGGLAGLTLGLLLAEKGQECIVLEAERVAWGASGRNGGFVSAGYARSTSSLEKQLGLSHAQALFEESVAGAEFVRARSATYPMARQGEGRLKLLRYHAPTQLERNAEYMNSHYGRSFSVLDRSQLDEMLSSDVYHHALFDPDTFAIDPLAYAWGLSSDLRNRFEGVLFEESRALSLQRRSSGWMVETANGSVEADKVVLAGSAYLGGLYQRLAAAVLPVATYVVSTKPLGEALETAIRTRACLSDTRLASDYYRRIEVDRLLWGGRITTQRSEPKQLAGSLKEQIVAIYPQLTDMRIDKAWSGLMGYAVHKMPIIGELEPGLWSCTAFGGHGLATTAAGALVLADSLSGVDDRHRLFDPFRARWGGGPIGRIGTQLVYWGMRLQDRWQESRADRS